MAVAFAYAGLIEHEEQSRPFQSEMLRLRIMQLAAGEYGLGVAFSSDGLKFDTSAVNLVEQFRQKAHTATSASENATDKQGSSDKEKQ